jgi:hypothetical protein
MSTVFKSATFLKATKQQSESQKKEEDIVPITKRF